jgi:hypothetical protein
MPGPEEKSIEIASISNNNRTFTTEPYRIDRDHITVITFDISQGYTLTSAVMTGTGSYAIAAIDSANRTATWGADSIGDENGECSIMMHAESTKNDDPTMSESCNALFNTKDGCLNETDPMIWDLYPYPMGGMTSLLTRVTRPLPRGAFQVNGLPRTGSTISPSYRFTFQARGGRDPFLPYQAWAIPFNGTVPDRLAKELCIAPVHIDIIRREGSFQFSQLDRGKTYYIRLLMTRYSSFSVGPYRVA